MSSLCLIATEAPVLVTPRHLSLVSFVVLGLAACSLESAPRGPRVTLEVAPLTLPGVADACYNLFVRNLDGAAVLAGGAWETSLVWQRAGVCSSAYGDAKGSLTYIGTCDADGPGGVRDNSVELELVSLSDGTNEITELVNPCPVGEHRCVLDVACAENRDTRVEFNLSIRCTNPVCPSPIEGGMVAR